MRYYILLSIILFVLVFGLCLTIAKLFENMKRENERVYTEDLSSEQKMFFYRKNN